MLFRVKILTMSHLNFNAPNGSNECASAAKQNIKQVLLKGQRKRILTK